MDLENQEGSPEGPGPGGMERLANSLNNYRHIAWVILIAASLALFLAILPAGVRAFLYHNLRSNRNLVSLIMLFVLVALSLIWSTGQRIDVWAFLFFNIWGKRPSWMDWLMTGLTQFGSGITACILAAVLFLANYRFLAYEFMLGTLTLWWVVELVKAIVSRSRPYIRLAQTRIVGMQARGRSFPSGHTSQAFFMAALLLQHFHLNLSGVLLLYILALVVGITRMYVGAHYPRDVLAGAILGTAWGLLAALVNAHFSLGGV